MDAEGPARARAEEALVRRHLVSLSHGAGVPLLFWPRIEKFKVFLFYSYKCYLFCVTCLFEQTQNYKSIRFDVRTFVWPIRFNSMGYKIKDNSTW